MTTRALLVAAAVAAALASPARAAEPRSPPQRVGACTQTAVKAVGNRLQSGVGGPYVEGSGTYIQFMNGASQVGYDQVEAADESQRGDRVLMCLVAIPDHCPPGDARGRVYTVTNLRTLRSWTMADSSHRCGGA